MMKFRTDLAIDKAESEKSIKKEEKSDGVTVYKSIEKKEKHITITFPPLDLISNSSVIESEIEKALDLLVPKERESILIAGLGNTEITPDSVGPAVANSVLATRHIAGEFSEKIGLKNLKSISVITPNVLGKTGIETAELISAAADRVKPQAIIVIDALASSETDRLFRTVQLSDCGILPGSGVKNSRKEISSKTLGVPTIALGVPTVVDIGKFSERTDGMIVTPKDVDLLCKKISEILSRSLNFFLQPQIDREIILSLV